MMHGISDDGNTCRNTVWNIGCRQALVVVDIVYNTDKDGIEYGFSYTVKFYAPTGKSGFYVVNLTADDAAGDGQTFDLPNGVTGGYTGEIYCGGVTLIFEGGIMVGVK